MTDSVDEFLKSSLFDVEKRLRRRLESLKDDLASDDPEICDSASSEAGEILDWLLPPIKPRSLEDRAKKARAILSKDDGNDLDAFFAAQKALRSSGRRRGRPRNETAQHAVRALTLHSATGLSWREIALIIRGCKHKRPNPDKRSCFSCGDAIRKAAERLDKFLLSRGIRPNIPRRDDLPNLIKTN